MHPTVQAQVNSAISALEAEKKANTVEIGVQRIRYGRENTITTIEDGNFVDISLSTTRPVEGPKPGTGDTGRQKPV